MQKIENIGKGAERSESIVSTFLQQFWIYVPFPQSPLFPTDFVVEFIFAIWSHFWDSLNIPTCYIAMFSGVENCYPIHGHYIHKTIRIADGSIRSRLMYPKTGKAVFLISPTWIRSRRVSIHIYQIFSDAFLQLFAVGIQTCRKRFLIISCRQRKH